jgi:SAM dependent carboxyl methyltransferase
VLPPGSVHLGWCSYAAVWLSHIPTLIPGHFVSFRSTDSVRAEFERQGAKDWETFLALRARELRPGGRLVVVLPALADDGTSGFENVMDQANAVLEEMVTARAITCEERARMVLGAFPRRKRDLLAPFMHDAHFHLLTIEHIQIFDLHDPPWADYEQDGNKEALATKHARFFRSVFMPSLASALDRVRAGEAEALRNFADSLETRLTQRLASHPRPMHSPVQTIVLAKRA